MSEDSNARIESENDEADPEPWLPVPVIAVLMFLGVVAGALVTGALVASPAEMRAALTNPVFYLFLAIPLASMLLAFGVQRKD